MEKGKGKRQNEWAVLKDLLRRGEIPAAEEYFKKTVIPMYRGPLPASVAGKAYKKIICVQAAVLYEFLLFLRKVKKSEWPAGLSLPSGKRTCSARGEVVLNLVRAMPSFRRISERVKKLRGLFVPVGHAGDRGESWRKMYISPGQAILKSERPEALVACLQHFIHEPTLRGLQVLGKMNDCQRVVACVNFVLTTGRRAREGLAKKEPRLEVFCRFADSVEGFSKKSKKS